MNVGAGRKADKVNRVVLSVLGGLMLIGGGVGLAYSLGAFGEDRSHAMFAADQLNTWLSDNREWLSIVVIVACLLLAALSLRWLLFQARPQSTVGDFSYPLAEGEGKTSLSARRR
jgi:hypothetical protein